MAINSSTEDSTISDVEILGALDNAAVRLELSSQLQLSFVALGIEKTAAVSAVQELLHRTQRAANIRSAEREVKALLRYLNLEERIHEGLSRRAELIHNQIREHVVGPRVLDLGCGDGLVASRVANQGYEVHMADIVDYRAPSVLLPFTMTIEGEPIPYDSNSFDTVLLLTVLHHANCPLQVFGESLRVSRNRIVVIESVFGVQSADAPGGDRRAQAFAALGDSQVQFLAFVDWFYNRVLHDEVQVPFKFNSPTAWGTIFRNFGMRETLVQHLGIDQPLVPEYHTLHVLEKGPTRSEPMTSKD
jgi:SAM-dependent methyltransferase